MAQEVKYNRNHHSGGTPEARIASRLRNSGDTANVQHVIHKGGDAPNRTYTNIHHSRVHQHGAPNKGEGDINNKPRGVV